MSRITFNVAAKCDKAGRAQNQDNYWVCPNLDKIKDTSDIGNDKDIDLSSKGALLVVADGMGGMKSGEKASEFVIEGIKSKFSHIPSEILEDDKAIIAFIKNAIVESDKMIKAYAKDHRESEGMGSTIVLVWLLGEKAYCGWCGDSRIYCYNPQNKLVRLSHDHSYVQSLVDAGKISEEEAFDHPDGNIITRSLGDSGEAANPETKIYPVHRRDVILLCSDGLCGLLNDEQIESILADNCTSSEDALKALWAKGEKEGWSDNATIEVACITDGGVTPTRKAVGYDEDKPKPVVAQSKPIKKDTNVMPNFWQTNKQYVMIAAIVAIVAIGIILYFSKSKKSEGSSNQEFNIEQEDIAVNTNEEVVLPEQSESSNQIQTPQKQDQPARPQKTEQPQNSHSGNNAQESNNAVQSQQPTLPQPVSNDYLNMLRDTHRSIRMAQQFISNARRQGYFTRAEANMLKDFIANAADLSSQSKGKTMRPEQEQALKEVKDMANKAGAALKQYRTFEDPVRNQYQQQQQQQQQQHQQQQEQHQPQQEQNLNQSGRGISNGDPV